MSVFLGGGGYLLYHRMEVNLFCDYSLEAMKDHIVLIVKQIWSWSFMHCIYYLFWYFKNAASYC